MLAMMLNAPNYFQCALFHAGHSNCEYWYQPRFTASEPNATNKRDYHVLTPSTMWGVITCPFLNFNGCTVKV